MGGAEMVLFLCYKIIQFLQITCYIFVGSSIIYYKDSMKIESTMSIKKIGYISLIVISVLLFAGYIDFIAYSSVWQKANDYSVTLLIVTLLIGFIITAL